MFSPSIPLDNVDSVSRVQPISDILYSFCTSTLFRGSGGKNSVKCSVWGVYVIAYFQVAYEKIKKRLIVP